MSETLSNSAVIPEVSSELFEHNPDAQFAVGIVGYGLKSIEGLDQEYQGYLRLRGKVYAMQKNYMPVEDLNDDGTETDVNDRRSVHLAVVENTLTSPRIVGGMRMIIKSREDSSALPIEEHYPEAFSEGPAPLWSAEMSRVISRHEDARTQKAVKWLMFTAGVSYIAKHDLGPILGAVEPGMARALNMEGCPVEQLSKPKFVPEFNATKQAIRVDMGGLTKTIERSTPDLLEQMQSLHNDFVYSGQRSVTTQEV